MVGVTTVDQKRKPTMVGVTTVVTAHFVFVQFSLPTSSFTRLTSSSTVLFFVVYCYFFTVTVTLDLSVIFVLCMR